MKTVYETDTDIPHNAQVQIEAAATQLLTVEPKTRAEAAEIVRKHGLWAYVGGHHVAIHAQHNTPRLALVTHEAPDWQ